MLLAIDIGNTNTVFSTFEKDEQRYLQRHIWRVQTVAARSSDEYAAVLNELFRLQDLSWSNFDDVIISSVVPETERHIARFCQAYLKKAPIMVRAEHIRIETDLDNPAEAGADRLLNAVGVKAYYKTPAIVIDFGTATTFDVIDGEGRYAGGVIAPGINLSVEALHKAAARLPSITVEKPASVIGKNTVAAMQSGVFWGYISLIEGMVQRLAHEMGQKPLVLATGGLAPLFAKHTPVIGGTDRDLTLKGLLEVYKGLKS